MHLTRCPSQSLRLKAAIRRFTRSWFLSDMLLCTRPPTAPHEPPSVPGIKAGVERHISEPPVDASSQKRLLCVSPDPHPGIAPRPPPPRPSPSFPKEVRRHYSTSCRKFRCYISDGGIAVGAIEDRSRTLGEP
ncbi:hypothetical protein K440DRAFT_633029 [Wilcoxina mikolae CBS 423.85]|nr:hypothetical protein K440DRAFT_633029 [Wilcoxina mikolae CBS 423.85]